MDLDGDGKPYVVKMEGRASQLPSSLTVKIVDADGKITEGQLSR